MTPFLFKFLYFYIGIGICHAVFFLSNSKIILKKELNDLSYPEFIGIFTFVLFWFPIWLIMIFKINNNNND